VAGVAHAIRFTRADVADRLEAVEAPSPVPDAERGETGLDPLADPADQGLPSAGGGDGRLPRVDTDDAGLEPIGE
ncbi:MAG: hypothetical protein ACOC95_09735, partial [Planctomycetota bacterium]